VVADVLAAGEGVPLRSGLKRTIVCVTKACVEDAWDAVEIDVGRGEEAETGAAMTDLDGKNSDDRDIEK